jgi:hypothetical protein
VKVCFALAFTELDAGVTEIEVRVALPEGVPDGDEGPGAGFNPLQP